MAYPYTMPSVVYFLFSIAYSLRMWASLNLLAGAMKLSTQALYYTSKKFGHSNLINSKFYYLPIWFQETIFDAKLRSFVGFWCFVQPRSDTFSCRIYTL